MVERIGEAAMLEQLAEEATELRLIPDEYQIAAKARRFEERWEGEHYDG